MEFFGQCSGLRINLSKTEIFPIRCQDLPLDQIISNFPGKISAFPGKYLGLPLHTRKLKKWSSNRSLIKLERDYQDGRENASQKQEGNSGKNCSIIAAHLQSNCPPSTEMVDKKDRQTEKSFPMERG
jgi:hypothetical protein